MNYEGSYNEFLFFFLKVLLIQNIHCPYLMFVIIYLETQLSWATLLVCCMGGLNFHETHLDMVKLGLSLVEDNIPFRGGQEIHVPTLGALVQAWTSKGFLVVGMNSSTCSLPKYVWNLAFDFIFSIISHSYDMPSSSHEIVFTHVSVLVIMLLFLNHTMLFMRSSNPFYMKLDLRSILRCLPMAPQISHPKRNQEWISIVSKFRFIVV